jgi:hypothetical protein
MSALKDVVADRFASRPAAPARAPEPGAPHAEPGAGVVRLISVARFDTVAAAWRKYD